MKIEKRSGSYRVQKMINGKRYSLTFADKPTKKEIEEEVQRIRNTSITTLNASNRTFKECAEELLVIKDNVLRTSTKRGYRSYLRNLDEDFKKTKLKDIDNVVLQKLINDLSKKNSPKTVENKYTFVIEVLATFSPDVRFNVNLPQAINYEYYIPTSEEVKAILDITNEKYYPIFLLGCHGLRWSEVMALSVDDIQNNEVRITKAKVYDDIKKEWIIEEYTKTTESKRNVPIDERLANVFIERGYVYKGNNTNTLDYLHRRQDDLGIPHFRFHDLRHYFATELDRSYDEDGNKTFSDKDIQRLGGWKSDHVMKRVYQHNRVDKNEQLRRKVSSTIMDAFE